MELQNGRYTHRRQKENHIGIARRAWELSRWNGYKGVGGAPKILMRIVQARFFDIRFGHG